MGWLNEVLVVSAVTVGAGVVHHFFIARNHGQTTGGLHTTARARLVSAWLLSEDSETDGWRGIVISNGSRSTVYDMQIETGKHGFMPGPVIVDRIPPGDFLIERARCAAAKCFCDRHFDTYDQLDQHRPPAACANDYTPLSISFVDAFERICTAGPHAT